MVDSILFGTFTSVFAAASATIARGGIVDNDRVTLKYSQGAKPVGGIYRIFKGNDDSTIQIIVLDEQATQALQLEEEQNEDDENVEPLDAKAQAQQAYAKAGIPKPALAEANFVMRTLSDDDQAFMRRQLLVGLEQGKSLTVSGKLLNRLAFPSLSTQHRNPLHLVQPCMLCTSLPPM